MFSVQILTTVKGTYIFFMLTIITHEVHVDVLEVLLTTNSEQKKTFIFFQKSNRV